MRLGLFNLMNEHGIGQAEIVEGTIACVKLVESIGFETAWFAEHHFSNYSLCPSPLMMAAAVARETSRIRLGPAVIVAPLYNPIRLAEELALVDQLSHGRVVLGIGSGYQRFEFDAFGADLLERQGRTVEIWKIIDQALGAGRLGFSGRHYSIPDVPQAIRLYRPRTIETFFTSFAPEVMDYAVQRRAVPFCTVGWGDTKALVSTRDMVAEQYRARGAGFPDGRFAAQRYVFVSENRQEVRRVAEGIRYAGRCGNHMRHGRQVLDDYRIVDLPFEGEPTLEAIEAGLPIGDPETVAERLITDIRTAGITDLSCFMWPAGIALRQALRSIERFGAEVLPLVQKAMQAERSVAA